MSKLDETSSDSNDVCSRREWVDGIADQFDAVWSTGQQTQISDFLSNSSGEHRHELLLELIRVDME